jgi:hypothetical protein
MSNKKTYTEKNIQKLIGSSLKDENRLDTHHKEMVLDMLLQKMAQPKKEFQPGPVSVIGLSVMWIVATILVFTEFKDSIYMLDLIKAALGLSMLFIPVSSIILIILKLRSHEKRMV